MLMSNGKHQGFTIVELLIVVVVIAILAAVSMVAYTNIQNRAYDSAIQNDLSEFAKKIKLVAVDAGSYPAGGATRSGGVSTGNSVVFPGFTFSPTKTAYLTTVDNLYYCTGTETISGQSIFRVFARSKSGNVFGYSSNGEVYALGNVGLGLNPVCQGMNDPHTWAYGHYSVNGTWWTWISD